MYDLIQKKRKGKRKRRQSSTHLHITNITETVKTKKGKYPFTCAKSVGVIHYILHGVKGLLVTIRRKPVQMKLVKSNTALRCTITAAVCCTSFVCVCVLFFLSFCLKICKFSSDLIYLSTGSISMPLMTSLLSKYLKQAR